MADSVVKRKKAHGLCSHHNSDQSRSEIGFSQKSKVECPLFVCMANPQIKLLLMGHCTKCARVCARTHMDNTALSIFNMSKLVTGHPKVKCWSQILWLIHPYDRI